jgi:hypothetical protein
MLTHAVVNHWPAVVRDVLALGYRRRDIFTELDLGEMLSIVVAAPPDSSVRYFVDQGWSREAHLLAALTEHQAGITQIPQAYDRPGIDERRIDPSRMAPDGSELFRGEVMTWDEMDEMDARWSGAPSGKTTVRKW